MKWKLIRLEELSGNSATVYSVMLNEDNVTLYEKFIKENIGLLKSEVLDIHSRLTTIGKKVGARENFFKPNEGTLGDGVCALYDKPNSKLRLYCIRYGNDIVVLGGGGPKSKKIRALQEDPKLTAENSIIRSVSAQLTALIKEKDITFSDDGLEFEGQLEYDDN